MTNALDTRPSVAISARGHGHACATLSVAHALTSGPTDRGKEGERRRDTISSFRPVTFCPGPAAVDSTCSVAKGGEQRPTRNKDQDKGAHSP
jgi:hypothetical protein